jgi:hypothetical protein
MSAQDHTEYRRELCAFVTKRFGAEGRQTSANQILLERQVARFQASVEKLDDEIYEAASNGLDKRTKYLEWVREQVPRWMAEAEERATDLLRRIREARARL